MTKPDSTLIAVILDRSGSMGSIVDDTIGGFNNFVEEQKAQDSDEGRLTLVQFSTTYETIYNNRPFAEVPELTRNDYRPGGGTALLDAMGKTINDVGSALAELPEDERPEAVVVVTITDGEENSSQEFTKEKVGELIKHQEEKYNWQFVFLGANFDAISAGRGIGIRATNSMNFKSSKKGMDVMYRAMSANVSNYRGTKSAGDLSFSAQQREDNENPDDVKVDWKGTTPSNTGDSA